MRHAITTLMVIGVSVAFTGFAFAHGDQPHPKCKKGYVLTDEHKCVKAPN